MFQRAKRSIALLTATATLLSVGLPVEQASASAAYEPNKAKNVIMLVPDGMSASATTLARYMLADNEKGTEKLTIDKYFTGFAKTRWDGGPITDSAPAGTAYATGHKSLAGALGIDANKIPRASLLEAAQLQDKAVGLVATSEFMHATPAAYAAHEEKRSNYATVAEQMLHQDIDVLLGSGSAKVSAADFDILGTAEAKGYKVVKTKAEMESASATKLWGDFTNTFGEKTNLSYDIDRIPAEEPSLAEMTSKAIELLSRDEDGFFLMVEGSKIDWAAHANDTVGIISDTLAFNQAFEAALEFAQRDGNTVVIAATDHGNSGISIGNYDLTGYDSAPFSILEPLKGATKTAEGAMALLNSSKTNTNEVLQAYGIQPTGYTPADVNSKDRTAKNNAKVNALIDAFKSSPSTANLVKIMNQLAFIGYTTGGHTGEDVPVYVFAPDHVSKKPLKGLRDNTEVAQFIAQTSGLDLDAATTQLFVDVTNHPNYPGAQIDSSARTLTLTDNDMTLKIKANQSEAMINDEPVSLNGQIAVLVNDRFYVPQSALDLLKSQPD
ncbi:alkaline phosphatase [Heliophilum fasciatum]|uniref:Alkaline phosphatase n=1 Tax=Heliophilum fasciatum TaxID=35700 RepID=A0A4R2RM35_9FIRM|nr:alkaline phosphatase [Heliophilum fasciatum]MCW2277673.1 alkaline phosphatase [Heliophilum fasciatum]TCP65020.1 alkaline phosphatase [Heliophilum fasciatum]